MNTLSVFMALQAGLYLGIAIAGILLIAALFGSSNSKKGGK